VIGLLQRVSHARVEVAGRVVGAVERGVLVFVGYRVFPDETGRMNRNVRDIGGGVLLVPQFTLAADTRKGTRASFTSAAPPGEGERLFQELVRQVGAIHAPVATGEFGADMQVHLVNDGPVTFWLQA
jgi:D-tyrosyl-tRNA(Tyr) deacylase